MKKLDAYKVYLFMQGATSLIFGVIFTVNMVYQVSVARLEPLQLVLVGTMLELTIFIFEVPTGVVADVYSRRLSVIIGFFLIGMGFILEGSIPAFAAIAMGQMLWGLGYTFTSGATQAWISDEIGEQAAGQAFLRGSQAGQIGGLIGIVVSVLLGSIRVNIPILVGGGLYLLLGFGMVLFMPEQGFKPTPRGERSSWQNMAYTLRGGLKMVRLRPALITILAIGLFYGLYSEGYDRLWTKHLLDRFSLPAIGGLDPIAWFGVINAGGLLFSAAATEWVRQRLDTNSHTAVARFLLLATSGLILSLLAYTWAGGFGLALAMIWLVDVTRSVIGPVYTTWVNQRLDPSVRATVLSMSSQVDAMGQIAGGPFVGVIGNLVSVRAAMTTSGLLLTPILALYGRALRPPHEAEQPSPAD